jgi:bis(5'-nucleosyl)-tetraphosphatase (symmetrical)
VHVVLGNHDLHCLAVGFKVAAFRKSDTFSDILEDADCNKWLNWLLHQPLMHENEHWVMVHAAVPPQWTLDQLRQETNAVHHALQADPAKFLKEMYGNEPTRWSNDLHPIDRYRFTVNALTRMRYVSDSSECLSAPKGPPSDAPKELTPWYLVNRTALGKRIVFGHWSALGLYEDSQVLCLDTGCAWGQVLSAKRLDANEPVIQVPCIGPGKSFT